MSLNHILLKTEMLLLYVTHILLYIFQMSVSVKKGPVLLFESSLFQDGVFKVKSVAEYKL